MDSDMKSILKSKKLFFFVLFLQCLVYTVVYLNVPLARQVITFAYLIYIPGLVVLKLLRLDRLEAEEEILYSVGLSVAFLMIFGVLINELLPIVGISKPLALVPLTLSVNLFLLLLSWFAPSKSNVLPAFSRSSWLTKSALCLPLMGLAGVFTLRQSENNSILLILILTISMLVVLIALKNSHLTSTDYSILILVITFALVFSLSTDLLSVYVHGPGDQPIEYYAYKLTETSSHWDSTSVPSSYQAFFPTYSMISVTILPTVFRVFLGINGEWIFDILYSFIVTFVPLTAYIIFKTQTDRKTAFLATFFLITISIGKGWGPAKQMVAVLFFAMLLLVIFEKRFSEAKRSVLFIFLGSALVLSHYAVAYIFMYIIFFMWFISRVLKGKALISLNYVAIFFTICLSWYIFVTKSATFNNFLDVINVVLSKATTNFWNLGSRGTAGEGIGLLQTSSLTNQISSIFFYISEGLIVVGFIKMLLRRKEACFSFLYMTFASANMSIIFFNILIPGLADTFLMSRFYVATLIILAPLCITGGEAIVKIILKLEKMKKLTACLILLELVPLFLFQTGFLYALSGDYTTSVLGIKNWTENSHYYLLANYWDMNGAKWLPEHATTKSILVYSDWFAKDNILTPYGMIDRNYVQTLFNNTNAVAQGSFIYLTYFNNKVGIILVKDPYNLTVISPLLSSVDQVYSNGECAIYFGLSS